MSEIISLYEGDNHAWLDQQAELIATKQTESLDYPNLHLYLAEMARAERRELASRMTVLLMHILKVQYQPDRYTQSWANTIFEQSRKIEEALEYSPSLKSLVSEMWIGIFEKAVKLAMRETGLSRDVFPIEIPLSFQDALDYIPPPLP